MVFSHSLNFGEELLEVRGRILGILSSLQETLDIEPIVISSRDDLHDSLSCDVPINAYAKINTLLYGVLDIVAGLDWVTLTEQEVSITQSMLKATNMNRVAWPAMHHNGPYGRDAIALDTIDGHCAMVSQVTWGQ